jgi:pimeloyl-ACP methyl ester carboxylesterase
MDARLLLARTSAALCALVLIIFAPVARAATTGCNLGVYRLSDGQVVDIAAPDGSLRWIRFDGARGGLARKSDGTFASSYGWTGRQDGKVVRFPDCNRIEFDGVAGKRIPLDVTDTSFQGRGVSLVGRLVLPEGKSAVPIVVLVHGSEPDSAIESYSLQRLLPAAGVGAFVYDKRGTGKSGGKYTQDFDLLADDVVAAMREARRLAGPRAGRIGYQGGSEGGWVAPIAANRAPVDFVIVCFGLAVTVLEEDQQEVALEMSEEGHSKAEIDDALKVARAAENVFASNFTKGFAELDALRAKYRSASWYKDLHGDFTWMILPHSEAELRALAPKYDWHTPFDYQPMPTLRASTTPQLWILGSEDYEAPSAETSRRIKGLIAQGHSFTLALYPGAEHGMTLFEKNKKGERVDTAFAPGYFEMMRDFARDGKIKPTYGNAEITRGAAK